jgi:hypothetical protein
VERRDTYVKKQEARKPNSSKFFIVPLSHSHSPSDDSSSLSPIFPFLALKAAASVDARSPPPAAPAAAPPLAESGELGCVSTYIAPRSKIELAPINYYFLQTGLNVERTFFKLLTLLP